MPEYAKKLSSTIASTSSLLTRFEPIGKIQQFFSSKFENNFAKRKLAEQRDKAG